MERKQGEPSNPSIEDSTPETLAKSTGPTSLELLDSLPVLSDQAGCRVVELPNGTVAKYGAEVSVNEALSLELVSVLAPGSAPSLKGVHPLGGGKCLVMSKIRGVALDSVWEELDSESRKAVVESLAVHVRRYRALGGGGPRSADGGECIDARRHARRGGPFENEDQFNDFLSSGEAHTRARPLIKLLRTLMRNDHRLVFTHSDLSPRNIMIEGLEVSGVLDWEFAGWYPEYWEYAKAVMSVPLETEWAEHVGVATGVYSGELALYMHLDRLL